MRARELSNHVQKLDESVQKADNACQQMGQKFAAFVSSDQSSQRAANELIQDLLQRLLACEAKFSNLENQIQQEHKGLAQKIDGVVSGTLNDREEAANLVRSAASELRTTLEQGFDQERERTTRLLQESGNIAQALTAYIDNHKQPSVEMDNKAHELQAALESEREAATQLTGKIEALEQKCQENEVLRKQWIKDIQTLDTARSQLEAVQKRIPQIESYEQKLDRIVEINEFIHSSVSFLTEEKDWIQQELTRRSQEPVVSETATSCEIDEMLPMPIVESNANTESQPPANEDAACRKVIVHSPDPGRNSPSPPPTVVQEQKRRREVTQLRSILKSHVAHSTVESGSIEDLSTRPRTAQNKTGSKEMVAEIRSNFLQRNWAFPTVADFERDIQLASRKKQTPALDDADCRSQKRLKTECCVE